MAWRLQVEMTDGTAEINARVRPGVGFYYDLVKAGVQRIIDGLAFELAEYPVTAVGVTPGWLRSERMLENFGVRGQLARGLRRVARVRDLRVTHLRRSRS